jgi:hypothetical protein
MEPFDVIHDPYRRCEEQCNHDLARGVLVEDLLSGDGPHPPSHLIVNFTLQRAVVVVDDPDAPIAAVG